MHCWLTHHHYKKKGAYSLRNATIDSINTFSNSINVILNGYHAGFGTLVICQTGHSCTIDCYGNSCDYLTTQGSFTLNYHPTVPQNESVHTVILYDSLSLTSNNDINCNIKPGSYTYDNNTEHQSKPDLVLNDNVPFLCCRGSESCDSTTIESNVIFSNSIICSGQSACKGIGIYCIIDSCFFLDDKQKHRFGKVYSTSW